MNTVASTTMSSWRLPSIAFLASLCISAVACGAAPPNEPAPQTCNPAAEAACTCPDGTQSIKQCKSDGTWGACQCTGL